MDIDAEKPTGEAATQNELDEAYELLKKTLQWFKENEFNDPYVDMSGNGYHILIKINCEINTPEDYSKKVDTFYKELPIKVDPATKDLARLMKVPGTMSLKGRNTLQRPHRLARIIQTGTEKIDEKIQKFIFSLKSRETEHGNTVRLTSVDKRMSSALTDKRIKELYEGNWGKHQSNNLKWSRSEAEFSLILALFNYGITPVEIPKIMAKCGIGKWQETSKSYQELTLKKAWNTYKSDPWRFFNGKKFIPSRVADEILEENKIVTPRDTEEIYIYDETRGIFCGSSETIVKEAAKKKLDHLSTTHHVNEVLNDVILRTYIDRNQLGAPKNLLVFKNLVYDLKTGETHPHSSNYYATTSIPINYNPNAKCPKIIQFIKDVLQPKDIDKIIQLFGYCLLRDYPIARIFVLTGSGRNGKSRLLTLLTIFLGKENVSGLTLQEISNDRFAKASLYLKHANIAADIPGTPIKFTGDIKSLTGGDAVSAQFKFRNRFDFVNFAKLIFSANEVPRTYDITLAFFRRMILVHFKNTFNPDDPKTDPNIIEKITSEEELSGLLNLALNGLEKLLEQGYFIGEQTVEAREDDWIKNSNPAHYFVKHFIMKSVDTFHYVKKTALYSDYVTLCEKLGKRAIANNYFSQAMKQLLPYIDEGQKEEKAEGKTKKKIKVWYGITVKREEFSRFLETDPDTVDTIDTQIPTLIPWKSNKDSINNKVRNTASTVSCVSENVEHLKRIAKTYLKREGYVKKRLFFNMLYEAGHRDPDAVSAALRDDPDIVFTEDAVRWRGGEDV
jgi:putative DNA primase/helicase